MCKLCDDDAQFGHLGAVQHIPFPREFFVESAVVTCPRCATPSALSELLDGEACPRCKLVLAHA